jgi:hypothetical protein
MFTDSNGEDLQWHEPVTDITGEQIHHLAED